MYLIIHALKNIVRGKGRYLLIGIVLVVSLISITVSVMIHFTAETVIDNYSDRFGARVTFTPDLRKLLALTKPDEDGMYHDPVITTEQYLAFARSDAVKSTLFQGSRQTYSEECTGLDQGGEENYYALGVEDGLSFVPTGSHTTTLRRQAPNTVVLGYSDYSLMEDFSTGWREIDEGGFFEVSGECMISREFADLNGLKLGDSLQLQDVNNTEVAPLQLTVCGIYMDITTPQPDGRDWAVDNRRNEILTSFSTLEEHSLDGLYVRAVYYLKNPGRATEFEKYVKENGLHEVYHVNVDAESYNRIIKPVENLKGVSAAFLVVILAAGCLILVLLSLLGVRERKYEIGVLRAIGMPKAKVAFGLVCESVCVLAVCLCIGLGMGRLAAQPVTDVLMDRQSEAIEQRPQVYYGDNVVSTIGINETVTELREMEIVLAPGNIALIAAISLVLGLLTNIAGVLCVMRYEPIKILSERN